MNAAAAAEDGVMEVDGCAIIMLQPAMHVPPVEAACAAMMDGTSARDFARARMFL